MRPEEDGVHARAPSIRFVPLCLVNTLSLNGCAINRKYGEQIAVYESEPSVSPRRSCFNISDGDLTYKPRITPPDVRLRILLLRLI